MKIFLGAIVQLSILCRPSFASKLFIKTESFINKGGLVLDQQFMDLMGTPYLLAHGMGKLVANATTDMKFPEKGN